MQVLSSNPLRTREDLARAAADIIRPTLACLTPGKARMIPGYGSAHYSEDVAGMEGFCRVLWALVPMLVGHCPQAEEFWPLWREEPDPTARTPRTRNIGETSETSSQRMAEMAVLGVGLCLVHGALSWGAYRFPAGAPFAGGWDR